MMNAGAIARRYARAIYGLAEAEGNVAEVGEALGALAEAVDGLDPGTFAPGLHSRDQRLALASTLGRGLDSGSTLAKFLGVLGAGDRLDQIPGINEWFRQMEDEAAKRVRLSIKSAAELDGAELDAIKAKFGSIAGREVIPEVAVDADLIGGVTVELEGTVYDGTVRTRLARLAARMAGDI